MECTAALVKASGVPQMVVLVAFASLTGTFPKTWDFFLVRAGSIQTLPGVNFFEHSASGIEKAEIIKDHNCNKFFILEQCYAKKIGFGLASDAN